MIEKRDYALQAFLLVIIVYLLQWAASLLMAGPATGYLWQLRMVVMQGATILLPAAVYIRLNMPGFLRNHRALTGGEIAFTLLAAALGLPALNALNGLCTLLCAALRIPMVVSEIPAVTSSGLFAASLFSIAFMPGLAEELLFRGCVMNSLRPYGTRRAILLSALLFAMMHGILQSLPVHFVMGLVLGLLYFYTGSLQAPILYHLMHNALTVLLNVIPTGTEEAATVSVSAYVEDMELFAGTMWALLIMAVVFGGLFVLCLQTVFRRAKRGGFVPVEVPRSEALPFSRMAVVALGLALALLVWQYVSNLLYAMRFA